MDLRSSSGKADNNKPTNKQDNVKTAMSVMKDTEDACVRGIEG